MALKHTLYFKYGIEIWNYFVFSFIIHHDFCLIDILMCKMDKDVQYGYYTIIIYTGLLFMN